MVLFEIFYDNLIKALISSKIGCNIYRSRAVCPAYADDLAIAAPYQDTLQSLLDIVSNYASKWRIQFNATKSAIIKVPIEPQREDIRCQINGQKIPVKQNTVHLGTMIGTEE